MKINKNEALNQNENKEFLNSKNIVNNIIDNNSYDHVFLQNNKIKKDYNDMKSNIFISNKILEENKKNIVINKLHNNKLNNNKNFVKININLEIDTRIIKKVNTKKY